MDNSPKQEKEQKELESSQDEIENLVTVQVVRDRKRTVENKESLGHIGQGSSNKVPKSDSATEISEHDVSEDLPRTQLLKHNVVSVRAADWNKVKVLSDTFDTLVEPLDKRNQLNLLSGLYCHVLGHCQEPSNIYWSKPHFAHVSYLRRFPTWKDQVRGDKKTQDVRNEKRDYEKESP